MLVIARSIPGPSIWKLWMLALSEIANVYRPGLSVLNALPLCFSVMVKPGPTVPTRRSVDIGAAGEVASNATAPAAASVQMILMEGPYDAGPRVDSENLEAPFHHGRVRIADELVRLPLPKGDGDRL